MYRNTLTTITAVLTLTINLVFSQVVINEIHYNPASSQGSDNDYEFLELYNPGTTDIDISGYYFTQGINHVFADATTLAAGAYLVLSKNGDFYAGSTQWGSGSLTNGGEDIEIVFDTPGVDGNSDGDFDDLGVDNNGDGDFDDPAVDGNNDGDFDDLGEDNNGDGDFDDAGVDNNGDGDFVDAGVDNNGDGDFDDSGVDANNDGDYDDEGDTAPDVLPDILPDVAPVDTIADVPAYDTAPFTTVVDFVDYEDGTNSYGDWGTAHDGGGSSLELIDATSDNSLAASWQSSWALNGTPGAANSSEPVPTVLTIYQIQYNPSGDEDSPYIDEYVETTGIVTGVDRLGNNSAFTIQHGGGAWNGIYCWWAADADVVVGDEVTVRGTVVEYTAFGGDTLKSMTEITGGYIVSVNSTGNTLPQPVVLAPENIAQEMYEGVLVTTTGTVVEEASDDNYGEWRISNNIDFSDMNADTVNVNDRFVVTSPALYTVATVTGPLNQWSGSTNSGPSWRIEPASEADVIIACENADLSITVEMFDSFGDGWNGGSYTIYGPQNTNMGSGTIESGLTGEDTYCLSVYDNYSIVVGGGTYDEEISFNVVDAWGNNLITGGVANYGDGTFPFEPYYGFAVTGVNVTTGCMDAVAVNYDPSAGVDDGSCYYYGDVCDHPLPMTGGNGIAAADMDQYFSYTATATGNMTVSSVGQTTEDTYLVILGGCSVDSTYNIDPISGDTLYVEYYYDQVLAENDDADYGYGVYQSEATICVVAGETYVIAWLSMYYPYDDSFAFTVEESPDITTPVGMMAYGLEDGISVDWNPIPMGCADATTTSRSSIQGVGGPFKTKPGTDRFVLTPGKKRDMSYRDNSSRAQISGPSLSRNCGPDSSEITFEIVGGSFASERSYYVEDATGATVASGANGPDVVCLPNGSYTVFGADSWGDGWNGGIFTVTGPGGIIAEIDLIPSGASGSATFEIDVDNSAVYGCMDPTALNYDAAATEDDGSCYFTGDICDAPIVTGSDGVTAGAAGWYSVDIPATAGALTVTQASGYVYVVAGCDYSLSSIDNYAGLIGYASFSTEQSVSFGAGGTTYGGDPTDVYLGSSVLVWATGGDVSISYTDYIFGCTDPNASNYDATATADDGSCECAGISVVMEMVDSWGDGWNGNTYMIVDGSGNEVYSGGLPTGSFGADEICIPTEGTFSMYVGTAPATSGSYQSEISWTLTAVDNGQIVLSGGAPFGANNANTFLVPIPEYSFTLYRNGTQIQDLLVDTQFYDSLTVDGVANLVAGTDYCYTVTQTTGSGADAVLSGQSEDDCSKIYVPSSCATAMAADTATVNNINGVGGRDEWFSFVPTIDGYVTVSSDIPDQMGGDTRVSIWGGSHCDSLVMLGTHDDINYPSNPWSTLTVVVSVGDTIYIKWENNYNPGPSIWTLEEFPSGHQAPHNLTALADHERVHLSWTYPMDPLSRALRSAHSGSENTMEENRDQISIYADETGKMEANREQLYQDYLDFISENPDASRDLTGTTISVMGSILNDDGTADILVGLNMVSPNNAWLSGVQFTLPAGVVVNSAVQNEGTTSSYEYCGEVYIEGGVVTFGDSAGVADPNVNPDGDWGCLWGGFHSFTINVNAFDAPVDMGYLISDDCYQDFDGALGVCNDILGTLSVPVPTDAPLCFDDDFEPNDILGNSDTWTVVPLNGINDGLTICPQDMDIFTIEALPYGGWVNIELSDVDSTGEMQMFLWDLSQSGYSLLGVTDTSIEIRYQNYGGIDGSMGPAQIVVMVQGAGYTTTFGYDMSITIENPEVYSYNIHAGDTDALLQEGVQGYNYTEGNLTNGIEYSFYAVSVNEDGLVSAPSAPVAATPRADQLFPPVNLVGQPWLEEVRLSWSAPPTLSPGNVIQSAFEISVLPFEGAGNTANGFENNYDNCSDESDSPDAVYKYTPTADITVDISTCYSSFDTKVYVFEDDTQNMVACNEDAGFDDYYTCGYYTSYSDSVTMTVGHNYYIVVDGWGGDAGLYNLQVFEHGDTTYTEGWDMDVVTVDPNHDRTQKAIAVEENLATLNLEESSRSLVSYEVLRYTNNDWPVIATVTGTNFADLNMTNIVEYSYKVQAVYHGGTSVSTDAVNVTPIAPIDVPVPVNFTASSNGWIVNLDWEQPDLGGGEMLYSENFEDGTLGGMTSEDLSGEAAGAVWTVGNVDDATSTYWSPGGNPGQFAFYNDDSWEYTYTYNRTQLTSASVDVSTLSGDAISGLALVGDVYWTQPSGPCDGGGSYAEELEVMISIDGGDWVSRGLVESFGGWRRLEVPLNLPSTTASIQVGLKYDDCGGNWGYGVAVDNFAVMVPPELELNGYMVYKDGLPLVVTMDTDFVEVVATEGTHAYSVTTWVTMFGESAPAGPIDVTITAPAPQMNPPRNLMVEPEGLAAHLHWDPPAGGDQWIGHDNGMVGNALGLEGAYDFQSAVRFPATDLIEFQGKHLSEIMFMGGSSIGEATFSVQVHIAETGQAPQLVYESDPISGSDLVEMDWNYYELDMPIPIMLGQEIWIGLRNSSNGYGDSFPLVLDNGETHNGLGNLVNGLTYYDEGFVSLSDEFGLEGNIMVRGFVSWPVMNILTNSGFDVWYPDPNGGWQNFPTGFTRMGSDGAPYGNMFVDADGAGVHNSDATLDVYDGSHSLKMWGMYAGGQNMWGSVYQTFHVDSIGGAGAQFDISAFMMSHADDWVGQGTAFASVFASYWEDPYGYTYMSADYSQPFDGTFNATEWHQVGMMTTIPDGATYVNIGIEYFQPNNDQHGSVYFDEFVARPVMDDGMPQPIQPIASSERSRKRTEDIFRSERKELIPLFDENIPVNSYRDADFEFLGYKVYRGTEVLDTLGMDQHMYHDVVGVEGEVTYHVSAVYEEDLTGDMEEAPSQMVTVDLQNAAPTAVNLITPEDETVITLTADNVSGSDLGIFWSNSSDADGDQVEYTLSLCISEIDDCIDSTLIGTNVFIPYSDLYAIVQGAEGVTALTVTWDVETSDEWTSTASSNGPWTLTVDAGWLLGTEEEMLPEVFALHNNYPNPFNPITNIRYDIPEVSDVRIDIYNLAGQRVRTLVSNQHQPGRYKIQWNATNDSGSPVASGMYIYKIHAKDFVSVKKLLLMK